MRRIFILFLSLLASNIYSQENFNIEYNRDVVNSLGYSHSSIVIGDYLYSYHSRSNIENNPVYIFDISDPQNIYIINSFEFIGHFNNEDFCLYENYLIITKDNPIVYDVSDPVNPVLIYELDTMIDDDDHKHCLNYPNLFIGNKVYNIENITEWVYLGEWRENLYHAIQAAEDNIVAVFEGPYPEEIVLYNIIDPLNPIEVSRIETVFGMKLVKIFENRLFIVDDFYDFIKVYDLSDPSIPREIIHHELEFQQFDSAQDLTFSYSNNQVMVALSSINELFLFTLDNSYNLNSLCTYRYDYYSPCLSHIDFYENNLIVTGSRISMLDIADPANPTLIGHDNYVFVSYCDFAVKDEYLYVPDNRGLLQIFSSQYNGNQGVYSVPFEGGYNAAIESFNNYLAIISSSKILTLYDIQNPLRPVLIDSQYVGSYRDFCFYDNYLYCTYAYGLKSYNVSDSGIQLADSTHEIHHYGRSLTCGNGYAYAYKDRLDIIDLEVYNINNPEDIFLENTLPTDGDEFPYVGDLLFLNNHLFIAGSNLYVFNLENPLVPELEETYYLPAYSRLKALGESLAILSASEIVICDVSYVSDFDTLGYLSNGIEGYYSGNAFLQENKLYISNFESPSSICQFDVENISAINDEGETTITDFEILSVYPNPFNSYLNVEVVLPERSFLNLSLFNILGQKVYGISERNMIQGNKSYSINADNFASGAYYLNVQTQQGLSATQKVILLK